MLRLSLSLHFSLLHAPLPSFPAGVRLVARVVWLATHSQVAAAAAVVAAAAVKVVSLTEAPF
jgi:negative regulator of sigma E activity